MDKKDKMIKSLMKQKSFAFALYYNECRNKHNEYIDLYNKHKKMCDEMTELQKSIELPVHIITELKELYVKEKKEIDCPICLDIIEIDDLTFSSCSHKYCKSCYDKLLEQPNCKCAVCRKKIYKKN